MNYELANIDLHIMAIDEHLDYINSKVRFIDPDEYGFVEADSKNLVYRFMHLFQLCVFISGDEKIDSSHLKLKFSDGTEYSIKEYTEECDKLCRNKFADLIIFQEKWSKIIDWNYYTIDWHLRELKKKLCRYKIYIECGNAPQENKKNKYCYRRRRRWILIDLSSSFLFIKNCWMRHNKERRFLTWNRNQSHSRNNITHF